jgi:hypothetical protein
VETHICTLYSEILGRHNFQFITNLADAATLGILYSSQNNFSFKGKQVRILKLNSLQKI